MSLRNALSRIRKIPPRTIVLFAILGIAAFALVLPKEEKEKDYLPLFQLNQMKGSNTPPVLYLSGKFTETWKTGRGSPAPRDCQYEMYIRGTDYYFLSCWHGNPTNRPGPVLELLSPFLPILTSSYSGWSEVEVIVNDFDWSRRYRWGRFGRQGGGGGSSGHPDTFAPGRRLWNQSGFIGAVEEGQVNKEWYAKETFKKLQTIGGFRIPRVIEFDRGDYSEIYRVQKCEFRGGPDTDWFLARKMEYYGPEEEKSKIGVTNSQSKI